MTQVERPLPPHPPAGASPAAPPLPRPQFQRLAREYALQWPLRLAAIDGAGRRLQSHRWWPGRDDPTQRVVYAFALAEALRWGEPTVSYAPRQRLVWAAPLMHNARVLGGLLVGVEEAELFDEASGQPRLDVRVACAALRELLERHNLTNAAFLEARRAQYQREQDRAAALQTIKLDPHSNLRRVLFDEEPALLAAVRRGDRPAARGVLNRVLMVALSAAGNRFELAKSVLVELVAALSRTAVEAGGDAEELLGDRFNTISELARFRTMEELAPWLHTVLERTMDAIEARRGSTLALVMADAVSYLRQHLHEDVSRDQVAQAMCLSPSHFSRLFTRHVGRSFTAVLTRMRVEHAAELLAHTQLSVRQVAAASGFSDQAYLTKVFRRALGQTPRAFRRARQGG